MDENGYWFANLGDARLGNLSNYFNYSASGDQIRVEAHGAADGHHCPTTVDTADDSPATALVLTDDPCTHFWTINLNSGWNKIALPLVPTMPYSAESICNELTSQGGTVAEIDRWEAAGWSGHICGLPFNDFLLQLAAGYFVKANASSSSSIEAPPVTTAQSFNLQIGWNSISVPHTDGYTAETLCDDIITQGISNIDLEIDRWHNGGWQGHPCGLPFNQFPIERGQGYFIKTSSPGTVTPSLPASPPEQGRSIVSSDPNKMPVGQKMPVRDLRISNQTDSSVTFSWQSDSATTGYVLYGETSDLAQVAIDVRGAAVEADTHLVTLTNLKPETSYYFKVVSGAEDDRAPDIFTTAPTLERLPSSDTVYGKVYLADGKTPATGTLLYLKVQDHDGAGSKGEATLLSALVDEEGYWHANLGNARLSDLSDSFSYSARGDELVIEVHHTTTMVRQTIDTANDSQAPEMRLASEPTTITLAIFDSTSNKASWLGLVLAALTMLAAALIVRLRR